MIDVSEETLIPVGQVPQKLPPRPSGKSVHVTSVYRWINHGVHGVKLESLKVGGTTYTSIEALQRFAEGLGHPRDVSTPPYSLTRQREIERAAREVIEMTTNISISVKALRPGRFGAMAGSMGKLR